MPIIKRDNKPDLYYQVDDFTDPWSNAPTLILQHGYGRTSDFWFQWVPYLSRFFKVVRPDLRGLGKSGKDFDLSKGLTPENYVEDLQAVIADLGDIPVHYCGESIGGIIGIAFAGTYPNMIRSLSLISAPAFISDIARKGYACGHESWPEAIKKMGVEAWMVATNNSTRFPPDMPKEFTDWYTEKVSEAGMELLVHMGQFALNGNVTPYLEKITAPVLCLYPTGGAIANDEQKQTFMKHVKNLRFVHLPTPYHMIHYIKPALCARQVLNFASAVDNRVCDE